MLVTSIEYFRVFDLDQRTASSAVLKESLCHSSPYKIRALDIDIVIYPGVFSPKYFHGWETFTRKFPSVRGKRVLEIGTGTGVTAIHLAKHGAEHVTAVDINPLAVSNAAENAKMNGVLNIDCRLSDVFSGVQKSERFDIIYWNLPFIYVEPSYEYKNDAERGLFDPGYRYVERYLAGAKQYLSPGGFVLAGLGDFADMSRFFRLAKKYGYVYRVLAAERSIEINDVEFQLYQLESAGRRLGQADEFSV